MSRSTSSGKVAGARAGAGTGQEQEQEHVLHHVVQHGLIFVEVPLLLLVCLQLDQGDAYLPALPLATRSCLLQHSAEAKQKLDVDDSYLERIEVCNRMRFSWPSHTGQHLE